MKKWDWWVDAFRNHELFLVPIILFAGYFLLAWWARRGWKKRLR